MKRMTWLSLGLIACMFAVPARAQQRAQHLNGIAAVVNDDVVLVSDVEEQLDLVLRRAKAEIDSATIDTLRTQILNQLIDEKLIFAEAKRQGLTAADAEVAKELQTAIQEIKQRFGGEEGFRRQLASENTSEEKLREKFRGEIQRQIIGRKLMSKMLPKKTVTAAEAETYFASNRAKFPKLPAELKLSLIQIPATPDSAVDAKARVKALALRKRITGGEKFAKVAAEASEDPATAKNGGDLGFFGRGLLDAPLEEAVFTLKIGELSTPVHSSAGWHLVEVMERDTLKNRSGSDSTDARGRPAIEVHARHILVRVPLGEADAERAKKLADHVRSQAAKGTPFEDLARRYSKYNGPTGEGGDLGFVSLGTLQAHIRAGLDSIPVGGMSEVLINAAGFNIFKVTDRKNEREYQLDEIRDELPEAVADMRQRERYDEWIKSLRSKAHIEIRQG